MTTNKAKKSGRSSRRNRDAEVVDAAISVFWKKGYSAASIQDVADQVGVLKGSLYYYIDSKEDLLFRIFDESHRQAMVIIEETRELEGPALERLAAFFESWLLWYLKHLERVSLYFNEWRYLTGSRREAVIKQRKAYEVFVQELIAEAQQEGDIPPDLNPKRAAFFLLGAVNAVPTWFRRNGPDRPEQIAETYRQMVLSSLAGYSPSKENSSSIA